MYLSKSKYCMGVVCKKKLWLDKYKSEVKEKIDNENVLQNGTEVGEIAKNLFGEYKDVLFDTNLNNMIESTNNYLKEKNVIITEASFNYNNNFCSVDILKKNNDKYEIYEVKSSTEVSDIYKDDISYQFYVLSNLGLNVTRACIVHLNSDYVRHGELELDKLFKIEDLTDLVLSKQQEVKDNIEEFNNYMKSLEEPKMDIGIYCKKPYDCEFFKYCSKHLPIQNVFNIRGLSAKKKFELYNKGIYNYEDLLNTNINDKYKEQIDFELNDLEDKINIKNIKKLLKEFTYPLYFLDFETYQQSIPLFDNVSPYMQIPFQYSLHYILEKDGELFHKEFLSEPNVDPRRKLAEALINDIPNDVCVLAYNMSFEKNVIRHLAAIFPDLESHLMNIHDNIKDLLIPFYKRDYYTKNMYGSYSIKYVLPALFPNDPSLDYHNLEMVHNGSEASNAFSTLGNYSGEELEEIRKNMLKYCELDTYAMVKIYKKLNKIVEEK